MDLSAGQDLGGGDAADWRTLLPEGSRRRSVDKIMDTMKRLLPFSGEEGIQEHMKMAVRFEEKTYTAAASQSDYSRKIYLEMLKLERESQNPPANSYPFNAASYNQSRQYPASLDSSSQTGNANGGDWQEEIFQKIRSMNDMYFPELNEMYQKIAAKLQKHDSLPQQPKNDPLEKLRFFKVMLERLIMFLRISKNEVQHYHKEKIIAVEKQIINILNSNKPRQPVSSILQGQLSQPHLHTTQQSLQPQSQISQMHPHENQKNSQMQPVNAQDCMTAAQQNNVTNLQNNSSSSVSGVSSEPDHVGALKMMTMETRSQNPTANSVQLNAAGNTSQNTHDPVL